MAQLAQSLVDFLKVVDDPAPAEDFLNVVKQWFIDQGILNLVTFESLVESDLSSLPQGMAHRAFIRRSWGTASRAAQAKTRPASPSAPASSSGANTTQPQPSIELGSSVPTLIGSVVAMTLDIQDALKKHGLAGTPQHLLPESKMVQALFDETTKAQKENPTRVPFTFCDLTGKETLPLWLPQSSLSAKREADQALGSDNAHIGQLLAALQAATMAPRAFKSIAQWSAAWRRYGIAAVLSDQLTVAQVWAHEEMVARIYEEERTAGRNAMVAIVYDEQLRREVERRAARRDPELDFLKVFSKRDDQVFEASRSRLTTGAPRPEGTQPPPSVTADVLAKQEAAAAEMQKKAAAAAQELQRQQNRLHQQQMQMVASAHNDKGTKGGGKKGGKPPGQTPGSPNAKQRKGQQNQWEQNHWQKGRFHPY